MQLAFTEKPSVYFREESAVVIFPSAPYWFSATAEIALILESLACGNSDVAVTKIRTQLGLSAEEAGDIVAETIDLLHSAGVLVVDGEKVDVEENKPDFQVNEVENVLVIATTQLCNMECAMCYAMAKEKIPGEMTSVEIKAVIDQLSSMPWENGISRVALTGGELFTRPDAMDLIEYVHNHGYFAQVNTNATLLAPADIKQLAKYPRLKMSISLDGCRAESHEYIRGEGTFTTTVNNIKALCDAGISVAVNMFIHAGNIDEVRPTLKLVDSLGVQGLNCLNMMNVGRGNSAETKQQLVAVPLADFYRKVFEAIRDDQRLQQLMMYSTFANQVMGIAGGVKSFGCGIGTNRAVYVKPDGTLYPCADTAVPDFCLGNLKTDSLAEIWKGSPILTDLRSLNIDSMNPKCAACDIRYICAGNCRGENYQTTRDLRSPHFKCEEIHDSVLELMWILTEDPGLFKCKVDNLYDTINSHATSA